MKKNRVVTAGLSLALALSFGAPAVTAFAEADLAQPAAEASASASEQGTVPEEKTQVITPRAEAPKQDSASSQTETAPAAGSSQGKATESAEPAVGEAANPKTDAVAVTDAPKQDEGATQATNESNKPMTRQDLQNQGNQVTGTELGISWTVDGKAAKTNGTYIVVTPTDGTPGRAHSVLYESGRPSYGINPTEYFKDDSSLLDYALSGKTMTFKISENAAGKTDAYGVKHDDSSYTVRFKLMWGENLATHEPLIRGAISLDGNTWAEDQEIAFNDTSGHKASNEVPATKPGSAGTGAKTGAKKEVTTTTTVTTKKATAATSADASLPKTGDNTSAAIPAGIAVAGAGVIGAAVALRRKEQRD